MSLMRWAPILLAFCAVGLQAAPFDKGSLLGTGARAAGQAGAVAARPDLAEALWWNPAGLGLRRDYQLNLGYGDVLGGQRFDTAFSHRGWLPAAELGYGLGWRGVAFPVDVAEQEFAGGVAFPFTADGRLQVGLALRALQARVLDRRAAGYGVDLGLHYSAPAPVEGLSVGLAARDMQAALEWPAGPRSDPAQLFQLGVAWRFDAWSSVEFGSEFAADPSQAGRDAQGFKLGGERWWDWDRYGLKRLVALRLGYLQSSALAPQALGGQFSAGASLQHQGLSLDYAFTQASGAFGATHRVGLEFAFGGGGSPTPTPTAAPTRAPVRTPTATPTPSPPRPGALRLDPESDIFAPMAQSVRQQARLNVAYQGSAVQRWTLRVSRAGQAQALRTLSGRELPRVLAWDGRDDAGQTVADGAYSLVLQAVDEAGRTLNARTEVNVDTRRPRLELDARPRVFRPSEGGISFGLGLSGEAGIPLRWTLTVAALDGQALKTFEGAGAPPAELSWDGRDAQGRPLEPGRLHFADFKVEMESGALAALPRLPLAALHAEPELPFRVPLQSLRFGQGEAAIALEDYAGLKEAAGAVKQYSSDYVLMVEGHAMEGESGSGGQDGLELSFRRAQAVADYLVESEGLDRARVRVSGFGETAPLQGAEPERRRRADLILYAR